MQAQRVHYLYPLKSVTGRISESLVQANVGITNKADTISSAQLQKNSTELLL